MTNPTPSPAAGSSKNYRPDNLVAAWIAHYHLSVHAPEMLDLCNRISTDVLDLITTQNDATYAKVMEVMKILQDEPLSPHEDEMSTEAWIIAHRVNKRNAAFRQSIAKIFGKADAKPEERQG